MWRRAAGSCQGSWVKQSPVWSHDFDFLSFAFCCPVFLRASVTTLWFLPAPLLGLEQGEAEEIFYGLWISMGRIAHGGQKKRSLQGARRLVVGREGVGKMLRPKLVHKNRVEIPQTGFLIFLPMQGIVWDRRPGHWKFLSPMSFTYAGYSLKSRKNQPAWAKYPLSLSGHHSKVGQHGIKGAFPPERSNNALGEKGLKMFF